VAMHEGRPLARVETEMRQARLLCVEIRARDPRFPPVAEAVGRRRIADIRQVDSTVWAGHLPFSVVSVSLRADEARVR
jgi:hypothetical protein